MCISNTVILLSLLFRVRSPWFGDFGVFHTLFDRIDTTARLQSAEASLSCHGATQTRPSKLEMFLTGPSSCIQRPHCCMEHSFDWHAWKLFSEGCFLSRQIRFPSGDTYAHWFTTITLSWKDVERTAFQIKVLLTLIDNQMIPRLPTVPFRAVFRDIFCHAALRRKKNVLIANPDKIVPN